MITTLRRYLRRGLTLSETMIVSAGLAVLLIVAALLTTKVRSDLKDAQAGQLLVLLDKALSAYHQTAGQWPLTTETQQAGQENKEGDYGPEPDDRLIDVLAALPASREVLEKVPAVLRPAGGEEAGSEQISAGGARPTGWTIQDPWGRRLGCLTANSPSPIDRQAVAANGGKPIFISAGPDGQFGTKDIVAAADNLRSDEINE